MHYEVCMKRNLTFYNSNYIIPSWLVLKLHGLLKMNRCIVHFLKSLPCPIEQWRTCILCEIWWNMRQLLFFSHPIHQIWSLQTIFFFFFFFLALCFVSPKLKYILKGHQFQVAKEIKGNVILQPPKMTLRMNYRTEIKIWEWSFDNWGHNFEGDKSAVTKSDSTILFLSAHKKLIIYRKR